MRPMVFKFISYIVQAIANDRHFLYLHISSRFRDTALQKRYPKILPRAIATKPGGAHSSKVDTTMDNDKGNLLLLLL